MSEQNPDSQTQLSTDGGSVIDGNITIEGGNFIGRDSIVHHDEVRGIKIIADVVNVHYNTSEGQNISISTKEKFAPVSLHPFEPETILIPLGPFIMGCELSAEGYATNTPQHTVELAAYHIGRYPVTNREYGEFIRCNPQQEAPTKPPWFLRQPPITKLNYPVTGISWHDAVAYCRWLSTKTGRQYRLPTEAEWEKAARGVDGRLYPWGNEWNSEYCNTSSNDTLAVTAHPGGASPFGCQDMLGNIQEWTSTLWGNEPQTSNWPYPYRTDDGREAQDPEHYLHRVYRLCRGGSYKDHANRIQCASRNIALQESRVAWRGFRVVMVI